VSKDIKVSSFKRCGETEKGSLQPLSKGNRNFAYGRGRVVNPRLGHDNREGQEQIPLGLPLRLSLLGKEGPRGSE